MNRDRVIPVPPRSDPELDLVRKFALPTSRSFGVGGDVRLSPYLPDDRTDRLLGYDGPVVATSSEHLSGAPQDRASAALDQDPATAWVTPFSTVDGQYVNVALPAPITVDHLDLQLVADGLHSVPTQARDQQRRGGEAHGDRAAGPGRHDAERDRRGAGPVPGDHRLALPGHRRGRPDRDDARVVLRVRPDDAGGDRRAGDPRRARGPGAGHDPRRVPQRPHHDRRPARCPVRVVGIDRRRGRRSSRSRWSAAPTAACRRPRSAPASTCCAPSRGTGSASTSTG